MPPPDAIRGKRERESALDSLVLERGEKLKEFFPDARIIAMPTVTAFVYGALALTTRRLAWIQKLGKSSQVFLEFPLENVKGVTTSCGRFRRTVTIADDRSTYTLALADVDQDGIKSFEGLVRSMIAERKEEIERGAEGAGTGVARDFSALKEHMNSRGLTLESFKCPSCGAPIRFPESGETVECGSCHATVRAEDIYDKISSLV